jgi:hypothetical protein
MQMVEKKKKGSFKISEESAKEQFDVFLRFYDLSFEDIEIEDGESVALTMRNYIVRSIRRGRLEILDDGADLKVVHHLDRPTENSQSITYSDKVAEAKIAQRQITGKKEDQARQDAFMAVLGDVPATEFMKLRGADYALYGRLAVIFSLV